MERLKRVSEIFLVPLDKIVISDEINNARLDMGDLSELAESIKESGLRVPILVKKSRGEDEYVLIQGKRRLQAIKMLVEQGVDFPGVKCFCAPLNYKIEDSLFDQIVMNDGKPYSNLEQGIVFSQLLERGYTATEIAKKTGKSNTHIHNCIETASLPKKVRDLVASGSVSGLTAVSLSKVVKNEDELLVQLNTAIETAPITTDGKKKKVTVKNIERIAVMSPMKKMATVRDTLLADEIENPLVEFYCKFFSRLKAGESVESIVELFK